MAVKITEKALRDFVKTLLLEAQNEKEAEEKLALDPALVAEVPLDQPDTPLEADPVVFDHTLGPPVADPSYVPEDSDALKISIEKMLDDVPEKSVGTAYKIVKKTLDNMHNVIRQKAEITPDNVFSLHEATAAEKLLYLISEGFYDNVGSMHGADGSMRKDVAKAASYDGGYGEVDRDEDEEDLGTQGGIRKSSTDSLSSVGKSGNLASNITMADIRKNVERIKADAVAAGKARSAPAQSVIFDGLAKRIQIAKELFPGKADDIDLAIAQGDDLDTELTFNELEQVHNIYMTSPESIAIDAFYKKPAKPSEENLQALLAREKAITGRVKDTLSSIEQYIIKYNDGEPVESQNVWHKYQQSEDGRELKRIATKLHHHKKRSRDIDAMPGTFIPPSAQTDASLAAQTADLFDIEKAMGTSVFRNVKDEGFMKLMFGLSIGPDAFEEKYVEFVIAPPEDAKKIKSFLRKHTDVDEIMANPEEGGVEKVLGQLKDKPSSEGKDSLLDQYLELVLRYLASDMEFPGAKSSKFHFNKQNGIEALSKAVEGLIRRKDKGSYMHLKKILEDPMNAKAVKGHLGKDWRMEPFPESEETKVSSEIEVEPEEAKPKIVRKGKTFRRAAKNENTINLDKLLRDVLGNS